MHCLILALLVAFPVQAGLIANASIARGSEKGTLVQRYQSAKARVDFKYRSDNGSFIYDSVSGNIYWVDHSHKSFMEIHKADLERVLALVSSFSKKPLDPGTSDFLISQSGSPRKVGKWTCTPYDVHLQQVKSGSFCVVPMHSVGAVEKDYRALDSLVEMVLKTGMVPTESRAALSTIRKATQKGFVVESSEIDGNGNVAGSIKVTEIRQAKLEDAVFRSPTGYKKMEFTSLLQKSLSTPSGK